MPNLRETAPVNAPRSCPNSSLSTRASGIAPQFTTKKGFVFRSETPCTARATRSFPVPLSPVMSTVLRLSVTRVMVSDSDVSVRLLLASTLARPGNETAGATEARTTLTAILGEGGMPGVQAAAALAALGDAAAIRALSTKLTDADPAIRRVAARSLARDALRPDAARRALADADATVRIAAAGGILSAHAAS